MRINAYLNFNGQCEEAFKFYEKLLGGKIEFIMTFKEMPAGGQVPEGWGNKIMHVRMSTPGGILMGSDAPPGHHQKPQGFFVSISVDNPAEADRIFQELASGGTVVMPIAETFWARRFGMAVDRFGIPWMVNCEKE